MIRKYGLALVTCELVPHSSIFFHSGFILRQDPPRMIAGCQAVKRLTRIPGRFRVHPINFNRVESYPKRILYFSHRATMSSLDKITKALADISIKPSTSISHKPTNSPATWKDELVADSTAPKSFELIKTLVYKPKTAKAATPIPVVVVARDGTETNSGALGKKLNLKELRLASEDLLTEFFSLDKNSRACTNSILYSKSDIVGISIPSRIEPNDFPKSFDRDRCLDRNIFVHLCRPRLVFE